MRGSRSVRVTMNLACGSLLLGLGMLAGCIDPGEHCGQIRTCGSKTLSSCSSDNGDGSQHRYKSSDGHSWSCTNNSGTGCETAAQEAADWCYSQTTAATPAAWGDLLVSELMYNPAVVGDEGGEWFEIHNPFGSLYDLFGCEIRNRNGSHTIASHLLVPRGAFRTAAVFATGGGFAPDYTYSGITFDNDAADEVAISCGVTLIDRLTYSLSQASTSGHAISVNPVSLRTRPAHQDGFDNNSSYSCPATTVYNRDSTGIQDYGTPGAANPACP
jgi:hypothetical protein